MTLDTEQNDAYVGIVTGGFDDMAYLPTKAEENAYQQGVLDMLEMFAYFVTDGSGRIINGQTEDVDWRDDMSPKMLAAVATRDARKKRTELDALAEKLRAEGYTVTEPEYAVVSPRLPAGD